MFLDYDEIIPSRLWIGGCVHPQSVPELKRIGITCVISLQTDGDMRQQEIDPGRLDFAYREAGIEWRRLPIPDFDKEALSRSLPEAVIQVQDVLTDTHARLYLHCTVGINRSATTAAAYLMRACGMTAPQACEYMISRRECSPFWDVLMEYERMLRESGS